MLSYQHLFHAGNPADVHKHALLAWLLAYMTAKDKPLSYIETHAGRGLYDLDAPQAVKTGEAAAGITRAQALFAPAHPYIRALAATRAAHGAAAYPGSPLIAAHALRAMDRITLAELHPQEYDALSHTMQGRRARGFKQSGGRAGHGSRHLPAHTPRGRADGGPVLYEVKSDTPRCPACWARSRRKWNVAFWCCVSHFARDGPHDALTAALRAEMPEMPVSKRVSSPRGPGHRMIGSGMAVAARALWHGRRKPPASRISVQNL